MDFDLIREAVPVLLKGLRVTAQLTLFSMLIGFSLGLLLAIMRVSTNRFVSGFAKYYSTVFRGTPLLVQIFLFYSVLLREGKCCAMVGGQ